MMMGEVRSLGWVEVRSRVDPVGKQKGPLCIQRALEKRMDIYTLAR
jgi:hypothetical protein